MNERLITMGVVWATFLGLGVLGLASAGEMFTDPAFWYGIVGVIFASRIEKLRWALLVAMFWPLYIGYLIIERTRRSA